MIRLKTINPLRQQKSLFANKCNTAQINENGLMKRGVFNVHLKWKNSVLNEIGLNGFIIRAFTTQLLLFRQNLQFSAPSNIAKRVTDYNKDTKRTTDQSIDHKDDQPSISRDSL